MLARSYTMSKDAISANSYGCTGCCHALPCGTVIPIIKLRKNVDAFRIRYRFQEIGDRV
jgi:hypothetical protein